MAKKFKRYLTHNAGTGRDTGHRDITVPEETFASNWCATFGHKRWDYSMNFCLDCGMTAEQGARPHHPVF